ncbi:cytochrome P450 [Mangrovimicrobium sediminis]|uniref:Cytochrome P450 n=1 Tax=Mangrovimicrobium sediminis TaxID=2562682 RepID=A0A4Z0M284_9GAMM|nr:cytochrome P450 [Haliea sp. SAOS-164]TGD73395.1 cytochrome P450 [Haliea sp. SAOS-164]
MSDTLTSDDPRYRELFDVQKEASSTNAEIYGDLSPAMDRLRDTAPVMRGSLRELLQLPTLDHYSVKRQSYTLFTFDLCNRALRENELFSSEGYNDSPSVRAMGKVILKMVGDEHRRYRSVVQPMFLRPKVENWWKPTWITGAVEALLDRIDSKQDKVDLNMDLCARLPVHIVTRGIGMDEANGLEFREHLLRSTVGGHNLSQEERMASAGEVSRMLRELITRRRADPQEDVISALITNDLPLPDGSARKLDDEEVFSYCRLIMLAGGGTTWRQLGITLHALLSNYHLWELCRDNRKLVAPAIEESARWMPTDPVFERVLTADVELEGMHIPAQSRICMCLGAANRDPGRWDNPGQYDPLRPFQPHLGFGMGPHRCLGLDVAKQEMSSALNALMDRYPNLRLDPDAPAPELLGGVEQRGMSAVPVVLR